MVRFPFGIFLTNICNCVLYLVIVRLEARRVWVRGNFDYESLFPGMTWEETHGAAWDFSITCPSKWGALWHFEAYPCVSDPQSSQPEAIADHSWLWRRENVKFIKILLGQQDEGDFMSVSCEVTGPSQEVSFVQFYQQRKCHISTITGRSTDAE